MRNDKGWKSLDPKSNEMYSYGKSIENGPYFIVYHAKDNSVTLKTYKDNAVTEQTFTEWGESGKVWELAFNRSAVTPLEQGEQGTVFSALGPNREKIYYAYTFEEIIELAVRDNQIISFRWQAPTWEIENRKYTKIQNYRFIAKRNGEIFEIAAFVHQNGEGFITYETGAFSWIMSFDKHQKLLYEQDKSEDNKANQEKDSATQALRNTEQQFFMQKLRQSVLQLYLKYYQSVKTQK